jgi:hypothetical protein
MVESAVDEFAAGEFSDIFHLGRKDEQSKSGE